MKQLGRRTIGLFLAVVMLLSLVPVAFADNTANFPDFPTGWSKEAMTAAVNNGLLNGYDDGNIHPEANLTRAQFAAIITRAFGAQTKADVSGYSDVLTEAWYYDAIAKAVKMGALNGKSSTQMDPDAAITRQEVFTAIARVLVLSNDDTSALDKFNDKGEIASWAINHMAALTQRGYVNGDPQGDVNPTAWISREEFAQVMHNAIRTYITEPGTYTNDLDGITVVRVGNVTLKGLKNTSDLVIGDGAGVGNINIESVTIEKRLLARGGTIKVSKSTRGDFVVVNNMNGITSFNNYRDEAFFKDIVENTQAKFLERAPGGTGGGGGGGTGGGTGGGGGTGDTVYTLTLKVDGAIYDTVTVTNGTPNKTVTDPTKDYYTFDGWYDAGDHKITNFATVTATQELTAKFTPIEYNVSFKSQDGVPVFSWINGYENEVPRKFTVENFALPAKDKVIPPVGYKLYDGVVPLWSYNGIDIEDLDDIKNAGLPKKITAPQDADIVIVANFEVKIYKVEYEDVEWKEGREPTDFEYSVIDPYVLPSGDDVAVDDGWEFKWWKLYGDTNNKKVVNLAITATTPETITLTAYIDEIPTDPVTVTFYNKYSTLQMNFIDDVTIEKGETVDKNAFPDPETAVTQLYGIPVLRKTGYQTYQNNKPIASVYEGNDYTHSIVPEFWYVKDGKITPFDETVEVNEDTNVYLLSKSLSLMLSYEYNGTVQALSVSADYNKDTRVMNTVKDIIARSGKQQLELALAQDMIPNYDEMVAKAVDAMVKAGIIELDGDKKNVQIVDVPIKISMLIKEQTIHKMVKQFIRDAVKDPVEFAELYTHVDIRGNADELDVDHIITGMTDNEIKGYVSGLNPAEKQTFADKLFEVVKKDTNYKYFVNSLMNKETFEINKANASEIAIIKKSIRELTLEEALAESNNSAVNKLVDTIGLDAFRPYYESMRDSYCDDLEVIIDEVIESSNSNIKKNYTTSLTFRLNVFDIYEKLYDKAADKVFDKLDNAGIYYSENKYLNFLIEQDFLSYLFDGDKSLASGDFTGYSLKGVMDYYNYLTMLLIVGDDALTWYGDDEGEGLTEAQLEALYDAMFDKIFTAHEKMNEILIAFKDEDKLPSKVQNAIQSVEKLNSLVLQYGDKAKSLIEKYLGSSINVKFEDESIADDERIIKMLDLLIGNEDPVLTIDTIYAVIYEYDDNVQEKLKQLVESDKFKQAIDKFETTSFGELFDGKGQLGTVGDKLDELKNNGKIESALDSVYDLFYILANEGIDAFKVPADEMKVTDIDIYKVKIAKVEMTVQRAYR